MSATVCNVLAVMLRTPGDRNNATMKTKRIVFTLEGLLNVNERAINRGQKCSKQLWGKEYTLQRELLVGVLLHASTVRHSLPLQVALQHLSLQCR